MTRLYAQLDCGIWDEEDFCALSAGAQRTYVMLISQKDIAACGVLPLTLRRWSRFCADSDIDSWLAELKQQRFVLIDEDTEEVLVRSFAKWDGGYKHAKRVLAVIASAKAIRSQLLRETASAELAKLGVSTGIPVATDSQSDASREATGSGRVVVTQGEYRPQPTSQKPQPGNREPAEPASLALLAAPSAQTIVAEWIERSPKRPPGQVVGQVAKTIGQLLGEGIDPDDIRRGLAAWMAKGLHPSTLPSVVNEVMNAPPRTPGKATTKAQGWLDLGRELSEGRST